MAFHKLCFSGSTDGRNIKVNATATPGVTVHTATTGAGMDTWDEVWIYAGSVAAAPVTLTIHPGGTGDTQDTIITRVPGGLSGQIPIIQGYPYRNGIVITATASTANVVLLSGWVNRIVGQG